MIARASVLALVTACSSHAPREAPVRAVTPDASAPPADAAADAAPRDAVATTLLPVDAAPTVIVTTSDECGLVLDRIYFPDGSSAISAAQKPVLDAAADMLACLVKKGEILKFEVQGHADDREKDPQRVSDERAMTVANALLARGVPATAMAVVGYGSSQPLDRKKTAAARAKNRRVDFLILQRPKSD